MNNNILPTDEVTEFEDRVYVNPNLGVSETNDFITNLRDTQIANNAQIAQQTQSLGTDVSSNLGGLTGPDSYFSSRYQTPQNNELVANLRATAQAAALNQALANEKAMWDKRYQESYRNYQKRAWDKQNTDPYANVKGDEPDYESTTPEGASETSLTLSDGQSGVVDPITGAVTVVDLNTNSQETIKPGQKSQTTFNASKGIGGGEIRVLPNGNRVLVKPGYTLVKEDEKYYLVKDSDGTKTEVGGY